MEIAAYSSETVQHKNPTKYLVGFLCLLFIMIMICFLAGLIVRSEFIRLNFFENYA